MLNYPLCRKTLAFRAGDIRLCLLWQTCVKTLPLELNQFNLIQGGGAKTVQIVRQATITQNQTKLIWL
ncbi:hypothetical protein Rin_00006450 [Candidatus Regiella insecticola 5.15]|uniref:Uncharacterized protein n=1 Tax=Candidatus Regiella insecticola 5.15 TaxID=1005043 RepID=G2GXZ8_9ENTR|nr:hypothetical protein Rin_00006450 [Candidatus Regiella insecticola 5.15]